MKGEEGEGKKTKEKWKKKKERKKKIKQKEETQNENDIERRYINHQRRTTRIGMRERSIKRHRGRINRKGRDEK